MKDLRQIIKDSRQREEAVHREILAGIEWLTGEQINARQKVPPADKEQPASDWKKSRRIFSLTFDNKEYFAAYQFDAMCQPLPVIRDVLAVLGERFDSWKTAAWFHFPNGWISGTGDHEREAVAPMHVLDRPDDVVSAVQHMHGSYVA
ncbi:hypothetical protein [Burkholderia pyrrocinia]|uniref:hypothetical protein n=1 Tax=Burkholderia pyrrocinia TaxID=60550 RepID=UPI002AB3037B|nr:hypothetical protein [Burkholderia pyrrocinia]